jgi:hypothetical protein
MRRHVDEDVGDLLAVVLELELAAILRHGRKANNGIDSQTNRADMATRVLRFSTLMH